MPYLDAVVSISRFVIAWVSELLNGIVKDLLRPSPTSILIGSVVDLSRSKAVLERACQRAFELGDPSPTTIRNMVKICTCGTTDIEWSNVGSNMDAASTGSTPVPTFARSVDELIPPPPATTTTAVEVAA